MGNRKELFNMVQARRSNNVVGHTNERKTLITAFTLFRPNELFLLLAEAERTGERIELVEDLTVLGEPTGMILVRP